MLRQRLQRLTTSFLVVLSLLFSQLALANYVCPPASIQDEPAAMEMTPGGPCESMAMASPQSMDQEQPVLCHQHCTNAPQSFDHVQVPVVSLPAVVQVLVVPLVMEAGSTESLAFGQAGAERPPPEPLFLSTLRLRV